eukprot:TRINITY_DN17956_c0_g1_i2.p1 TRINITY_DN17956_c0_g1~~TRINITY_DN17956_c0_g1_i2.p1  ORF type:complete len:170 (-),score=23.21 TRINITY_DN17956_c0_g1_i2:243-752(-)
MDAQQHFQLPGNASFPSRSMARKQNQQAPVGGLWTTVLLECISGKLLRSFRSSRARAVCEFEFFQVTDEGEASKLQVQFVGRSGGRVTEAAACHFAGTCKDKVVEREASYSLRPLGAPDGHANGGVFKGDARAKHRECRASCSEKRQQAKPKRPVEASKPQVQLRGEVV